MFVVVYYEAILSQWLDYRKSFTLYVKILLKGFFKDKVSKRYFLLRNHGFEYIEKMSML